MYILYGTLIQYLRYGANHLKHVPVALQNVTTSLASNDFSGDIRTCGKEYWRVRGEPNNFSYKLQAYRTRTPESEFCIDCQICIGNLPYESFIPVSSVPIPKNSYIRDTSHGIRGTFVL